MCRDITMAHNRKPQYRISMSWTTIKYDFLFSYFHSIGLDLSCPDMNRKAASPMAHFFQQVDVFTAEPLRGNPLAVVHDADDLSADDMARFANWTNLSETTFLLKPSDPKADYQVRIFTPTGELPFAGHPTLGSCFAWLKAGGVPKTDLIVQQCAIGLVTIRRHAGRLYFAAPPLRKSGPVDDATIDTILAAISIPRSDFVDANWTDNGPGWVSLLLKDAGAVLRAKPEFAALKGLKVGIVGAHKDATAGEPQFEIRAFTSFGVEDPVTGSLNAGVAQWLIGAGIAPNTYIASQGTALGRRGRVFVESQGETIWIGGDTVCCIEGTLNLTSA
jgi:PhzF family phenazine biosynthesis protein